MAEEQWRIVDRKLVNYPSIQILLDDVSSSGDSSVSVPSSFSSLSKSTLNTIIHEVKSGPTRPFPGLAHLVGQNEDRCVKGRFFGPEAFSPVEHLLPHNANASALEGFFQHTIVMAGLTALAKLEVLSEEPLLEHPTLQLRP